MLIKKQSIKSFILISALSIPTLYAQHFTDASSTVEGTTVSSTQYADVDNDGDADLIITGYDSSPDQIQIAKLYLDDGNGMFTESANTPFVGVADGAIAFADVDNDDDQDVIIAGLNTNLDGETHLYLNDGNGNFSVVVNTPFANVYGCGIDFSDFDSDGDQDVLIAGFDDVAGMLNAVLYENNGNGIFSAVADTPFQGSWDASLKFVDTDNDGDEDVIIAGRDNSFAPNVLLYTNENGIFTEVATNPFIGVIFSAIDYADIDGDNDYDLLISGQNSFTNPVTALYINEGGTFVEDNNNPFVDVDFGSHAFSDIDYDGDQDVLITGYSREDGGFVTQTKLYINDGNGIFTEALDEPFTNFGTSEVVIFDANGDNAEDIFIIGDAGSVEPASGLYFNNNKVVSTSNITVEQTIKVSPNPAHSSFAIIHFPDELINREQQLKIVNTKGQLLYNSTITLTDNTYPIDITTLGRGLYFIEITTANHSTKTTKLIIK